MKRDDITTYLNSVRKTDAQDSMHKWIGTYNLYLTYITRFFKWLYYPDENPRNRPKPKVVGNIPQLKRGFPVYISWANPLTYSRYHQSCIDSLIPSFLDHVKYNV